MRMLRFPQEAAQPSSQFQSVGASSVLLGDGEGEAHVVCLYFGPDSVIGEHPTGFGQLFLVMSGAGWASGADGQRVPLSAGEGVYFERGELHSKGSETGMSVLMVQVRDLTPQLEAEQP